MTGVAAVRSGCRHRDSRPRPAREGAANSVVRSAKAPFAIPLIVRNGSSGRTRASRSTLLNKDPDRPSDPRVPNLVQRPRAGNHFTGGLR
jgi:hypothetical protein